MTSARDSDITIRVNLRNPGQFFGCCGLLELAGRLWPDSLGWFQENRFLISARQGTTSALLEKLREAPLHQCDVNDDMTSPLLLGEPFSLRVDWWLDTRGGGSMFKTWAGQQKVVDIANGMREAAQSLDLETIELQECFRVATLCDALPFNFDADLGGLGSDRDVGFSFDPLKSIRVRARPLLELAAMVGLQRFRPKQLGKDLFYAAWSEPLPPSIASAAAACAIDSIEMQQFQFRLLYRTKYLKSFLAAKPV